MDAPSESELSGEPELPPEIPPSANVPPPTKAVLLVNTKSRRGQEWFDLAQQELKKHGIEIEKATRFEKIDDLMREGREAIERGIPMIIAGGGDGTFNALSDLFVGKETVCGLLPLGTGNSLARDLGIQADVAQACEVIAKGKVVSVDLGYVNGTHFVNVATIGLTTRIAQNLTNDLKKRLGRFVYAVAIWRAMRKSRPFRAVLETENGTREFDCLQFVIGNGRFHAGPFPIAPDASIISGALNIYAVEGRSKWVLLKYALSLPGGHQVALAEVFSEKCNGGKLSTTPRKQVTVDGEVCTQTPIEFRSVPKGMRVVVPADWEG